MENDDEAARKARADRLREQIDRLKDAETDETDDSATPESPRDFIDRRMKEFDPEDEVED